MTLILAVSLVSVRIDAENADLRRLHQLEAPDREVPLLGQGSR
ncbi:MAG TPA: hypothetical protein VFM55_19095 [Micromonosporaceae bacterium]|nr:hypothetical protein [Micromonosporaceae bacterium]